MYSCKCVIRNNLHCCALTDIDDDADGNYTLLSHSTMNDGEEVFQINDTSSDDSNDSDVSSQCSAGSMMSAVTHNTVCLAV